MYYEDMDVEHDRQIDYAMSRPHAGSVWDTACGQSMEDDLNMCCPRVFLWNDTPTEIFQGSSRYGATISNTVRYYHQ